MGSGVEIPRKLGMTKPGGYFHAGWCAEAYEYSAGHAHRRGRAHGCAAGDMLANARHELIKSIGPDMDRCWFDIAMLWDRHDPSHGSPSRAIMLPFSYNCSTKRIIRADVREANNIFRDRRAR
jgi:hypothetical protein